jgi:hypothetical protein
MNAPLPKKITITINPLYGIIYGSIILLLLISALIISGIPLFSNLLSTYSAQSTGFNPFVCTFKKIIGIPCMTCGGTRSFFHFAHLRLKDSFLMNPLIFLIVTAVLFYGMVSVISLLIPHHRLNSLENNNGKKELKIVIPLWLKRILIILVIGSVLINWEYLIFVAKP